MFPAIPCQDLGVIGDTVEGNDTSHHLPLEGCQPIVIEQVLLHAPHRINNRLPLRQLVDEVSQSRIVLDEPSGLLPEVDNLPKHPKWPIPEHGCMTGDRIGTTVHRLLVEILPGDETVLVCKFKHLVHRPLLPMRVGEECLLHHLPTLGEGVLCFRRQHVHRGVLHPPNPVEVDVRHEVTGVEGGPYHRDGCLPCRRQIVVQLEYPFRLVTLRQHGDGPLERDGILPTEDEPLHHGDVHTHVSMLPGEDLLNTPHRNVPIVDDDSIPIFHHLEEAHLILGCDIPPGAEDTTHRLRIPGEDLLDRRLVESDCRPVLD